MSTSHLTFKLEGTNDGHIKTELPDTPSPGAVSDTYMDDVDVDDPELDFKDSSQPLWITKLPKHLWETLAKVSDDQEIELGTIRVEGSLDAPQRVSLLLNKTLPFFSDSEQEFLLDAPTQRSRRLSYPGQVFVFSEKNMPGYKPKGNIWDALSDNEHGQGRSTLYEDSLRAERRKENKGKYTPYARKPIPKITALAGVATKEFECRPARNKEHRAIEARRTKMQLSRQTGSGTQISIHDPRTQHATVISAAERQSINKQQQLRRARQREHRAARLEEPALIEAILRLFREHRFWGLRDLKARLVQPESWVKENLEKIAIMHRAGDFNGRWELKEEYKAGDEGLRNAQGVADKVEDGTDTDMGMKTEGDSDGVEDFEDV